MLKKGMAIATVFIAASNAYAGGPDKPPAPFVGGFYAAVGLSRDTSELNSNRAFQLVDVTEIDAGFNPINRIVPSAGTGWGGYFGLGYGYVGDDVYLGFEAFGDIPSTKGTVFQNQSTLPQTGFIATAYDKFRVEHSFGAAILPGLYADPGSMLYLRIGYIDSEFEFENQNTPTTELVRLGNQNKSALQLGFGANTQMGRHVSIRQEFTWDIYGSIHHLANSPAVEPVFTRNAAFMTPHISRYDLAFVYAFSNQSNAPNLNATPMHAGGHFYAGLNLSYNEIFSQSSFWQDNVYDVNHNILATNSEGSTLFTDGWGVGLLLGYGKIFNNRWYAGLEAFANYNDAAGRFAEYGNNQNLGLGAFETASRLFKQWDAGLALTPGYQVSDAALLYARVGFIDGDFKLRSFWNGVVVNTINTEGTNAIQNALASYNREQWLPGLQLGVGVDTLISHQLSARMEFNINNYGNFNYISSPITFNATSTERISTHHKDIIEDTLNLSLIWHFFK